MTDPFADLRPSISDETLDRLKTLRPIRVYLDGVGSVLWDGGPINLGPLSTRSEVERAVEARGYKAVGSWEGSIGGDCLTLTKCEHVTPNMPNNL